MAQIVSLSLAGSIWLHNPQHGWVTLGDLERLLRKCPSQGRLLSRQKYWKDSEADLKTLSLEEVNIKKEEDKKEAEYASRQFPSVWWPLIHLQCSIYKCSACTLCDYRIIY